MPRYFLHLYTESKIEPDLVGVEFPSLEAAVADARQARTEYLRDEGVEVDWARMPLRDHGREQKVSRHGASRRQLAEDDSSSNHLIDRVLIRRLIF